VNYIIEKTCTNKNLLFFRLWKNFKAR
jgi:hypothetical protein